MVQILVIDHDASTYDAAVRYARAHGGAVTRAESGRVGLELLATCNPDVVLFELALQDMSGLDVLQRIRQSRPTTACLLVTAAGTYAAAAEALRHGVCDLAGKPLVDARIEHMIDRGLRWRSQEHADGAAGTAETVAHSVRRWAAIVVRGVAATEDPRTLSDWGRGVAVSPGALRNWCRTAGLPARRSLLFMRVLRAVQRQAHGSFGAEELLDIVDRRTITKLMALSGGDGCRLPRSVPEFLERQALIDNPRAVTAVRTELARSLARNGWPDERASGRSPRRDLSAP
jgi:CheY-like chemotaxis protein